jgi:hypothetical protein
MTILRKAYFLIALTAFVASAYAVAQQNPDMSPLGFTLGTSYKDAKNKIEASGKRIMENSVDSKKVRYILMQGTIVDLPFDLDGKEANTSLQFYDKKLLSSSLVLNAKDPVEESQLRTEIMKYLTQKYGKPSDSDDMLYFKSWTWKLPNVKLIFHTNQKTNVVKMQYTYEPVNQAKVDDELDDARGIKHTDPATEMFMKGDYSRPSNYYDSH